MLLPIARQHLDAYTASLMLILSRLMRLKALGNSQTDRGSVAWYTSTALECAMFVGVAPLLYDLLTSRFAFTRQLALLFTQGTGYFRKASEMQTWLTHICAIDPKGPK